MVASTAMTPSMTPPNTRSRFVNQQGILSSDIGMQVLTQHHKAINGLTPTISCTCANVGNVYTLTPFPISPNLANYFSYWSFAFVASATSTGAATATVVPTTANVNTIGVLPTLPMLATHGSSNATLTINLFYVMYYVDTLNSGNGAFVVLA